MRVSVVRKASEVMKAYGRRHIFVSKKRKMMI